MKIRQELSHQLTSHQLIRHQLTYIIAKLNIAADLDRALKPHPLLSKLNRGLNIRGLELNRENREY